MAPGPLAKIWRSVQVDVAHKEAQLAALRTRRQRQARNRFIRRLSVATVVLLAVVSLVVAEVYAGSPDTLPSGESIAGVDVGGLSTKDAVRKLEQKAGALAATPVVVHVAGRSFPLRQADLGIKVDWAAAVQAARAKSDGFGPLRGFRRLFQQIFGVSITPTAHAEGHSLDAALNRIVGSVGREPLDAKIVLHGLTPTVVPGRPGISIDQAAARKELLARFAGLDRTPVVLPLGLRQP